MPVHVAGVTPRHSPIPAYEVDPLTIDSPPDGRWTIANTGEQMPGVLTPLCITLTTEPAELGFLGCFAYLGIIPDSEVRMPTYRRDYHLGYFYGRCTANVPVVRRFLDLMPGTSGAAYEAQMFGGDGLGEAEKLSWVRWPIVAVKLPLGLLKLPGELRSLREELQPWWNQIIPTLETATMDEAKAAMVEAERAHGRVTVYVWVSAIVAQLAYGQLCGVVAASGNTGLETTVCGGYGTEELDMATDFWATSRGRMTKEEFLGRHGWTVPRGMEIAEPSWRERPEALDGLLANYAALPDEDEPALVSRRRADERRAAEKKVLGGLKLWQRPKALLIMKIANEYMQLRTIQKAASAIAWDVMRASARRLGVLLADEGKLDHPDDVFHLTAAELLGPALPANAKELVADRRARHEEYLNYTLPIFWTGNPEVEDEREAVADTDAAPTLRLEGMGVSPGVIEGPVRVVNSPTDATVEGGEILVCETTDPSWVSLMVLAAGLVIDIGGPVSHGAIVARELGVPCVINTRNGSRVLKTGQRVRIDGATGVVEVLED